MTLETSVNCYPVTAVYGAVYLSVYNEVGNAVSHIVRHAVYIANHSYIPNHVDIFISAYDT